MKKHLYMVCALLVCSSCLYAQNSVQLVSFSTGYSSPLGLENCGDTRLFVVQQGGKIMICDAAGNKVATPFLDISDRVKTRTSEQGLLGLAFHPNYLKNGFFYVNYINSNGNTQISRFKVSAGDKNVANRNSEKKLLEIAQPFSNHNGGCIRFGPDGYLYIGMGDGGSGGDPQNNAQNPASLLGKMLRIDINSSIAPFYKIPPANPFVNTPGYKPEIWAVGLRNPWRWSFDDLTGALVIADVGQESWEEVDLQYTKSKGGENYGWRCYEGNHTYNTDSCKAQSKYVFPRYEYAHSDVTGDCSVTGGFVYRGTAHAAMYGKYYFTDYCSGIIRSLILNSGTVTKQDEYKGEMYAYTSFGEDNNKELYVVNISSGTVYHIIPAAAKSAAAPLAAASLSVYPNPATTYCTASYTTAKAESCTIGLFNAMGVSLTAVKKMSIAGKNNWQIMIPANIKGECYITVTTASGTRLRQNVLVQ